MNPKNLFCTSHVYSHVGDYKVEWEFTPYIPAQICGPIDSCYPEEPSELVDCKVYDIATNNLIATNGESFLRDKLGDATVDCLANEALQDAEEHVRDSVDLWFRIDHRQPTTH